MSARPRRVSIAVWLYLASLALGLLSTIVVPSEGAFWFTAAILLVMLLLGVAIWHRRNWARIAFLILFVIGLPMVFGIQDMLLQRGNLGVGILVAQTLLQAASLFLLFTAESRAWYRRALPVAEQPFLDP